MRRRLDSIYFRLLALGAGLPLFISCSLVSLFYEQFPRLAVSRLDDDFDLTRKQQSELRKDFEGLLEWHRQNELPRYATVLKEFHDRLEDGEFSEANVDWAFAAFDGFRKSLLTKIYEEAPSFLRSLSPKQITHFEAESKDRYKERFEHLDEPVEDYIEDRVDRWEDRLENWTGGLSDEQVDILRKTARATRELQIERRDRTLALHQDFLVLLRTGIDAPDDKIVEQLWAFTPPTKDTPLQNSYRAMMVAMAESLSKRQQARFKKELGEWEQKIRAAMEP